MQISLKNKKIIIVGPASYMDNLELGEMIDNFDVVIRINKGYKMTDNSKKFGYKTDILVHCVNMKNENGGKINNNIVDKYKIKNLFFCYPYLLKNNLTSFTLGTKKDFTLIEKENLKIPYEIIDKDYYINLENKIGCRPNSGLVAIDYFSKLTNIPITVIGFTFFKNGYSKYYREKVDNVDGKNEKYILERMEKTGVHNQEKQIDYFKKELLSKINFIDPENMFSNTQ